MELHQKFDKSPRVDFSILSNENSESLIKELINSCDKELLKGTQDIKILKSYHMILCHEYQYKKLDKLPKIHNFSMCDLFSKLKLFSQEQLLIIYDIIILKLIFKPTNNIFQEFEHFRRNFNDNNQFEEKETRHLYMKMIECFLDAFRLLEFLKQKVEKPENLSDFMSRDLETWYRNKDDSDWKSLVSLLPKLIEITGLEALSLLWDLLQDEEDLKNSLTGLCIFINSSLETEIQKENLFPFFSDERLWRILLAGLKSRLELERKQALHLFKIITEFFQKQIKKKKETEEKRGNKIPNIPFSCDKNADSINLLRNNYILILESLEEKRHHMVFPSLSLLNYLVLANVEHQNCGNCFDFPWLSCVFDKILQHENNTVIKFGISYILKMNPELYDDHLIQTLAKALNNRFLYESEENQIPPKIVKELENLFIQAENSKIDFLSKFLSAIVEISWDPISIFYITFALSSAGENVHFPWKEDQLMKVKNLVEKNLKLHSPFLRRESQINTIVAMTRFTKEIDLKVLANFLSAFPNEDETLSRGSKSWEIILNWLQENKIKESEVETFIRESCKNMREGFLINIESFARVFVILCDLNLVRRESKFLMDVFDFLYNFDSIKFRLYIDFELIDRVLELIYHFVILTNASDIPWEIVSRYLDSALDFLLKSGKTSNLRYEKVQKYSAILSLLSKKLTASKSGGNVLKNLEEEAIHFMQSSQINSGLRRLYEINILQVCQESKDGFLNQEIISTLLTFYKVPLTFTEEESLSGTKGKASTEYYTVVGKIINCYLEKSAENSENWFLHASTLFDKAGTSGVPFVIEILSKILGKGLVLDKDLDQVKLLIRTCWRSILTGKRNRLFWTALHKLLKLLLNPKCFGFQENFVHEFINEILKEGEAASNIKVEFLKNLEDLDPKWLFHFHEALLDCLFHGQLLRRDTKVELQTLAFLSRRNCPEIKNQKPVYMGGEFYLNHNLDSEVRARAIILFYKGITHDDNYSSSLFPLVIKSLRKFKGKRYFGDSNSHRIQQRIFQVLLILEPILDEGNIEKLRNEIVDIVLSNAADQPSIQIMMSWILSRIYSRNESNKNDLWNIFKEVKEKRPGNVKFVAGVILQISNLINQNDECLKNFLTTAISHLAPECLGPTFNTRLACQIILVKLYERMQEKDNLYKAIVETLNEPNFQIANEFYYDNFHLLDNYSLQSIYYEVPRLTNLSEDELIPPTVFKALRFSESIKHPLKLLDESNSLSLLNLFSTRSKATEKNEISNNDLKSFDIQKKIIPQISTISEDQESGFNKKNTDDEAIIVVASLVERVPNLGGIARTCEVFGASELVLGNKKCTENKEFQSLSVTAEKWIKVTEVKPHELSKYLLEMKDKGWKLVGLEQTAYSSSLLKMNFEKKTLLLLGNEKDGIPPHLIPILDTCVEIPQIGVIRSLNVHVTGAICIWEYAKQHSFTKH